MSRWAPAGAMLVGAVLAGVALAAGTLHRAPTAPSWPQFRGPNAGGVAGAARPPVVWNAEEGRNVRWKTAIPGFSHASPIVWGSSIFVATAVHADGEPKLRTGLYGDLDTTAEEGEVSWLLYALDKESGEVRWRREVSRGRPPVRRHLKGTHANSTPATDGKRVVALFGSAGRLAAFDLAGKALWTVDLGAIDTGWFYDSTYQWGHASSPVLWKGRVIVQVDRAADAYLAAFDAASGRERWRTARPPISSWGTPTVVEGPAGPEIVTDGSKGVRGYDPRTGRELWRLAPTAELTVATPVVGHGLVYVSNGYRPVQPVYAIRPGGRGEISLAPGETANRHVAWSHPKGGTYIPTPIVVGDQLYTLANDGRLTCYQARTGDRLYEHRVGGGRVAFSASPVAADSRLYLASEDGDVYVIKAGPAFEILATNPLREPIMASPAISGDVIFVRTRSHLFALQEQAAAAKPAP